MPGTKRPTEQEKRIGRLEPRFAFALNPYPDQRFTSCSNCGQRMHTRKEPFFVHVDPLEVAILNMTARYCPTCDLLILHKDVVGNLLAHALAHKPAVIGNDYLVLGTVERSFWRTQREQGNLASAIEHLHDFRAVWTIEVDPGGWFPADDVGKARR